MKHPVKYSTIEELASDNKLWYKYAYMISKKKELAYNMVSDMYIIMIEMKLENPSKTFSKSYIYTTLVNLHIKSVEYKPKEIISYRDSNLEYIPNEIVEEQNNDEYDSLDFYNYTMNYLDDCKCKDQWFHNTLFRYVVIDGLSIRELERRSNIHFGIIQRSIIATKKLLKENYKPKNG